MINLKKRKKKKQSNLYSVQYFLSFGEKQLPASIRRAFTWQQLAYTYTPSKVNACVVSSVLVGALRPRSSVC
jgi:hypothetical protein